MKSPKTAMAWLAILLTAFLIGCAQLPEGLRLAVERFPDREKSYHDQVMQAHAAYDALAKQKDWDMLKAYAEREDWASAKTKARDELHKASIIYKDAILPIYDENKPHGSQALGAALNKANMAFTKAVEEAEAPVKRAQFLVQVREQAPAIYAKAQTERDQVEATAKNLDEHLTAMREKHAQKADDLIKRWNVADSKRAAATTLFGEVEGQFRRIEDGTADWAKLGDAGVKLSSVLADLEEYVAQTNKKVAELDTTYVRILADQKIDYYAHVGRISWCEVSECYSEDNYTYPGVKVTEAVAVRLEKITGNIADLRPRWGENFTININRALWNDLKVNYKRRMNSRHDAADYWIERIEPKAYHRYTEVVDGKDTLGDWVTVSEDTFWKHQEHLGLALVSKPVGSYTEESLTDPEPVGSSLVAKPTMVNGQPTGSNQYGHWNGGLWHYYGMYRFFGDLAGVGSYGYHDWDHYNRRSRGGAYYGRDDQWGTYGSSTYKNARYYKSAYAKRNPTEIASARTPGASQTPRSGRPDPSIRGAGSAARNKGPGGRGKS